MLTGIQAGGGVLLGEPYLSLLASKPFEIIRIQAYANDGPAYTLTSPEDTALLVTEIRELGFTVLVNIRHSDQIADLPDNAYVWIEAGNEPDLEHFGWTVETYRTFALNCVKACEGRKNPLFLGAVSNLNRRGYTWLKTLPWNEIIGSVGCSHHWYPDNDHPHRTHRYQWWRASDVWAGRRGDVVQLLRITGPRPFLVSETGYNMRDFTETAAAGHMGLERAFWQDMDYQAVVAYQLVSGPDPQCVEDQYGFLRTDLTWRPVVDTWTRELT